MKLSDIKVGDTVTRMVGGDCPMQLEVTAIENNLICCGPWTFSRTTGGEIDEDLGWNGVNTGSYLVHDDLNVHRVSVDYWGESAPKSEEQELQPTEGATTVT